MKMKTIRYVCIVALLAGACRTTKTTQREQRQSMLSTSENTADIQQQKRYLYQGDSSGQALYFWSDTAFSFRQDSGLRANKGWLLLVGKQTAWLYRNRDDRQVSLHATDSLSLQTEQKKSVTRSRKYNGAWYVMGAIALLAVVWRVWRRGG